MSDNTQRELWQSAQIQEALDEVANHLEAASDTGAPPDVSLRLDAARNPSTPTETLAALAEDKDWNVRWGVSKNANTPASALAWLAQDAATSVRAAVSRNPNTPIETVETLTDDTYPYVARCARGALKRRMRPAKTPGNK